MGTIYTLITGLSIVGIEVVDIILSVIFDCVSFAVAWKIGRFGSSGKIRRFLHWTSRIGIYAILVIATQSIFIK